MTFQQLSYLLEVYQCGSITRAAEKLYLAQSSVSAAIGSLERELGYPIFRRVKSGIVPTAQGQIAINYARRICEDVRLMQEADSTQKKHIHFCATDFIPFNKAFAQLVEEMKDQETVFHWETDGGTFAVEKKLAAFQVDMAFILVHTPRVLEVETRFGEQKLICERLGEVPAAIILGPGHTLYNQPQVKPEDLEKDILVDATSGITVNNPYLKGVIRLDPDRTVYVSNWNVRNMLVSQGSAYAIGVGLYSEIDKQLGLRKVPIGDLTYTVLAVHHASETVSPELKRFAELIKEEMRK